MDGGRELGVGTGERGRRSHGGMLVGTRSTSGCVSCSMIIVTRVSAARIGGRMMCPG